jgi:two-component system phosphate regulon sensor histidine kinase PhoR
LGIRTKLFLVSVVLIGLVGLVSGVFLEGRLHGWILDRVQLELTRHARTVRVAVEGLPQLAGVRDADALADSVGAAIDARVTIIDDTGVVLGDSSVDEAALVNTEDHGSRPEIVAARQVGLGTARRRSATTGDEMLYVAVPFQRADSRGHVRVAMPLAEVDVVMWKLRVTLVVSALLGLVLATVMSVFASHLLSRRLRLLLDRARLMADGHAASEVPPTTVDEIAGLDRSLSRMDDALEEVLTTLARERDRFEAVLEGMEEAVIAVDGDKRVTLVNRAGLELMAHGESPLGRPFSEVVQTPRIHQALDRALAGEPRTVQMDLEAEERRICSRVTPQRSGLGAVVVLHDVTRLRRLETMRRDFVANVSHELRTPVSVIRLNAETLRDGALTDPRNGPRFVEALLRNAERLSDLISDLLDISRIESGKYPMHTETVSVGLVARQVVDSVEQLASERQTALVVDVPDRLEAHADAKALDQVLVNLVQNAVKYSPPGSRVEVIAHAARATRCASRCATTARAFRQSIGRGSSSASTGSTPAARSIWAAPGSACRSSSTSWR